MLKKLLKTVGDTLTAGIPIFNTGIYCYGWAVVLLLGIVVPTCIFDPKQIIPTLIAFGIGLALRFVFDLIYVLTRKK